MLDTTVGYTGGTTADPTYQSMGDHTEALRVTFDPRVLPLDTILRTFWKEHTPMPKSFGMQYRSAIFAHVSAHRHALVAMHVGASRSPGCDPIHRLLPCRS